LAAGVVKELEDAVQAAVAQAGPEATAARNLGRQATARKHRVGDLLRELRSEPVQVFEQATWSRDAGVERLQRIAQEAPGELPKIGRAYLDILFDRARREGGFERPAGLWERWNDLGPRTKMLLFQDRGLVRDLDNFFLLAKKLDENPNPSGSGYAVAQFLGGQYVFHDVATGMAMQISAAGLSKLLHSRQGVKLLTQGLRTPVTNERAAAATASQLAALAGKEARPVALPAAAQRDRDEAP